jgi:hypothetical protein
LILNTGDYLFQVFRGPRSCARLPFERTSVKSVTKPKRAFVRYDIQDRQFYKAPNDQGPTDEKLMTREEVMCAIA